MAHKNKKLKLIFLLTVTTCLLFCGCEKKDKKDEMDETITPQYTMDELRSEASEVQQKYTNMDFSKSEIIIPEGNEIEELIFPIDINIADSKDTYQKIKDNFYDNISLMTGKSKVNEKYVSYKLPMDDAPIPINKVKEDDRKRSADSKSGDSKQGFYLSYNDSKYTMLLYGSSYMLEMSDDKVAGYSENGTNWLGNRPPEGTVTASYDLPADSIKNISYPVDGKEVALSDAVTYVEKNMGKGYHYVRSQFLDYKVCRVDVVKLDEDNYYYRMSVRALYQGISFSYEDGAAISPVAGQEVDYENASTTHTVAMMSENSIDYIWSSAHSYEEKKEGEIYTKFISIKNAMDILNSTVSAATNLTCDRVELLYRTEFHRGESGDIEEVQCHPVYQFKFTNTGLAEYPVLYFNVDALSGLVEASNS